MLSDKSKLVLLCIGTTVP